MSGSPGGRPGRAGPGGRRCVYTAAGAPRSAAAQQPVAISRLPTCYTARRDPDGERGRRAGAARPGEGGLGTAAPGQAGKEGSRGLARGAAPRGGGPGGRAEIEGPPRSGGAGRGPGRLFPGPAAAAKGERLRLRRRGRGCLTRRRQRPPRSLGAETGRAGPGRPEVRPGEATGEL